MKQKEDISLNAALIGFGNNSISLLVGMTIFSTVFALSGTGALEQISKSGPANTGLTFIYLPLLLSKISSSTPVNLFFASIFFLALFFAALTSLISMVELSTRTLIDFGIRRSRAILLVSSAGFLLGIPSAVNPDFLVNQDWVWGVGLIISGFFISFSIIKFGPDKFRNEIINSTGSDVKIGRWYNFIIGFLIPLLVVILVLWWLISSASWDPHWWNPFHSESAGTCLFQWGIVISIFIILNKSMVKLISKKNNF